jgi:hypothetical protein
MKDWKDILYEQVIKNELKKLKMNLKQRLKPQFQQKLEVANIDYPAIVQSIEIELEETDFVCNMKYGIVGDMNLMFKTNLSPYEFFEDHDFKNYENYL